MKPVAALVWCVTLMLAGSCGDPVQPDAPIAPDPVAPAPSYQFGAKFEPPIGRVVHGMGQWQEYNPHYLSVLPPNHEPAAELIFIEIGDTVRPWKPAQLTLAIQHMWEQGRIPLLDIGLRGNQPLPSDLDTMTDKLFGIDDEVAGGSKWDPRLADLVELSRSFGRPLMVRIGGEFNGWWNGYHPYDFPRAFRKIVAMFRAAGASNVAFVWCYEPAAPDDFDAFDGSGQPKWYPGSDVVDWFSIDFFAKGDFSGSTTAHGGLTPFGRTLKFLDLAVAQGKPVVIAESSPAFYDLGNPEQAQAAWTEWFAPYFALIAARPEIKWFHYIDYDWTKAGYYLSQGWKNNDLTANSSLAQLYAAELALPKYLHSGEKALLKDFGKYP